MPHQTSSDPKQILWKSKPLICDLRSSHQENSWRSPHHQALFRHSQATLHLVNPMRVPIITTPSSGGLGRLNKQWLECWFKKNSYRPRSSLSLSRSIRSSGTSPWFLIHLLIIISFLIHNCNANTRTVALSVSSSPQKQQCRLLDLPFSYLQNCWSQKIS